MSPKKKTKTHEINQTAIVVAVIGLLGTVIAAYFSFAANTSPTSMVISATQTAEAALIPTPTLPVEWSIDLNDQKPSEKDASDWETSVDALPIELSGHPLIVSIDFSDAGNYAILDQSGRTIMVVHIRSSPVGQASHQVVALPPGNYMIVLIPEEFRSLDEYIDSLDYHSTSCSPENPCDPVPVSVFVWEINIPDR